MTFFQSRELFFSLHNDGANHVRMRVAGVFFCLESDNQIFQDSGLFAPLLGVPRSTGKNDKN
ncbi:MAG: hypothetical protein WAR41_08945 [Azonexus sp.]